MSRVIELIVDRYKQSVDTSEIMYIRIEKRKSTLYLKRNIKLSTNTTLKTFLEILPEDKFIKANKNVIIALDSVINVNGTELLMLDGTSIPGSVRRSALNKHLVRDFRISSEEVSLDVLEYKVYDKLPVAFNILELVINQGGKATDLVFRYGNESLEELTQKHLSEMINQSFYKVFNNGDKKWLIAYTDVAINGGKRVIYEYSPEVNKNLVVCCFQPKYGYCACLILDLTTNFEISDIQGKLSNFKGE
ncbi:MAG: LytTR family DNA-binding domain-containing protein [Clostridia bacterium]